MEPPSKPVLVQLYDQHGQPYQRNSFMCKFSAIIIQLIVASLVLPYGTYLLYYTLDNFYSFKYGLWVVISFNTVYKFSTSWTRSYCKNLNNQRVDVYRRNIIIASLALCLELVLVATYNTPMSQLFFGIIGGLCTAIITVHARFYLLRFIKSVHIPNCIERTMKPFSIFLMPIPIMYCMEMYGIRFTQLIMSAIYLHLIPAALIFRPFVSTKQPHELLHEFQTKHEQTMEMQEMAPRAGPDDEEVVSTEIANENVQVEVLSNESPPIVKKLPETSQGNEAEEYMDDSSPEIMTQTIPVTVETTALINPEKGGQTSEAVQNVKEKEPTERVRKIFQPDDTIEVIPASVDPTPVASPAKEAQVSEVPQDINETEPTRRVRNLFQRDETIEVITESTTPSEAFSPLRRNPSPPLTYSESTTTLNIECDLVWPLFCKQLSDLMKRFKTFLHYHIVIAIPRTFSKFHFYPAVISSAIITVVPSVFLASIPYIVYTKSQMFSDDPWTMTREFSIYHLPLIATLWMGVMIASLILKRVWRWFIRFIFVTGQLVCACCILLVTQTVSNGWLAGACVLFGLGHGMVSYMEIPAYKEFYGKHWIKGIPALEIYHAFIALFIYLVIYFCPLIDEQGILTVGYSMYFCNACIWILAYIIQYYGSPKKNLETQVITPDHTSQDPTSGS